MTRFLTFSTVLISVVFAGSVMAHHRPGHDKGPPLFTPLDPPQNVLCPVVDDMIAASWDAVAGASKYAVEVLAEYDITGDGLTDVEQEFGYNTADRTDGGLPTDPNLMIPLADVVVDVTDDGVDNPQAPIHLALKVKAMNPGKGAFRQNHPFSDVCDVF